MSEISNKPASTSKKVKTKYTGVYQYESSDKKFNGRPDICYHITYKENGKKIWKKIGWKSEGYSAKFAFDERSRFLPHSASSSVDSPTPFDSIITYAQAFAIFDERHLSINTKSPKDERGRFEKHIKKLIGHKRLDQVSVLELENIKKRYKDKLAPATIRHILSDIRRVYRKMAQFNIYKGFDPTLQIRMPKVDNARTRFLTKEEAKALLLDIFPRSEKWHDITALSLFTGMRLSEILRLSLEDLDIENRLIFIRDSKSGSRTIPMNRETFAIIYKILSKMKNKNRVKTMLFTKENGKPLAEGHSGTAFKNAVISLQLNPEGVDERNKVSFHTLRHTYCSWLAMEGVPLYTIGELVGHHSQEMTKRYSHLCPDKAKAATAILDSFF